MSTRTDVPATLSPDEEERVRRAHKRVEELRGFYVHLMIYLVVNTGIFIIDLLTPGGWWFFWPLIGWGIGLGAHAVAVFAESGLLGQHWEERKVEELLRRDEDRR